MSVDALVTGTQVAVIGTEHFVSSADVVGTFTFHVDLRSMQAGDTLELRIYQKTLAGDTPGSCLKETFEDAPVAGEGEEIAISIPVSNDLVESNALRFSLKQTFGTGRSYKHKVLRYL